MDIILQLFAHQQQIIQIRQAIIQLQQEQQQLLEVLEIVFAQNKDDPAVQQEILSESTDNTRGAANGALRMREATSQGQISSNVDSPLPRNLQDMSNSILRAATKLGLSRYTSEQVASFRHVQAVMSSTEWQELLKRYLKQEPLATLNPGNDEPNAAAYSQYEHASGIHQE